MASSSKNIYIEEEQLEEKTKRLCNPEGNRWDAEKLELESGIVGAVAPNGLGVDPTGLGLVRVLYAEEGFPISVEQCRGADNFLGAILYYFEVTIFSNATLWVGLSDGAIAGNVYQAGKSPNSYMVKGIDCRIEGERLELEADDEDVPRMTWNRNVYGCGLLMDPNDDLAVFFTMNSTLIGNKIPIAPNPRVLFPTIEILGQRIVGNFDGPFEYDIDECPGLELD